MGAYEIQKKQRAPALMCVLPELDDPSIRWIDPRQQAQIRQGAAHGLGPLTRQKWIGAISRPLDLPLWILGPAGKANARRSRSPLPGQPTARQASTGPDRASSRQSICPTTRPPLAGWRSTSREDQPFPEPSRDRPRSGAVPSSWTQPLPASCHQNRVGLSPVPPFLAHSFAVFS